MDRRLAMGRVNSRREPVLLLSISSSGDHRGASSSALSSIRTCLIAIQDRSTTAQFSNWLCMGRVLAKLSNIWRSSQSWALHREGACLYHYYGDR